MSLKGSLGWIDAREPEEFCPLLSIACKKKKKCIGWDCAMWVFHLHETPQGTVGTGDGHCGLIHPRHEGLVISKDIIDD